MSKEPDRFFDPENDYGLYDVPKTIMPLCGQLRDTCELAKELEDAKIVIDTLRLSAKNARLEERLKYKAENKALREEIKRYKPMPLFLHGLGKLGFHVVINEDMPENQIWFATQKQLDEALSFSMKQFEQALKGGE